MNDISNAYFEWLCSLIRKPTFSRYNRLLIFLHDASFRYSIARDGNRYEDGINMRYRFSRETNLDYAMVATELCGKPCSMLEMMVALASRCEDQIMSNSDYGNRTGTWFWGMVETLGLQDMTDRNFDENYCHFVIERFLERDYEPNGNGGLFRVDEIDENTYFVDFRNYDIWYQAMCYLNKVLEGGQ